MVSSVIFDYLCFTVPITSVNLISDQTAVNFSQQIRLTCTTDFCIPAASITWYKAELPIMSNINQSVERNENTNLKRTISVLTFISLKEDNMKQVYCTATNPISAVNSTIHFLDVRCKSKLSLLYPTKTFRWSQYGHIIKMCYRNSSMDVYTMADVALCWVIHFLIDLYFNCYWQQRFWLTHIYRPAYFSNACWEHNGNTSNKC